MGKPKPMTPFAELIQDFMWSQRPPWSAARFADEVRVARSTVWNWLNAGRTPEMDMLPPIAEKTGIPIAVLAAACGYSLPNDQSEVVWEYIIKSAEHAPEPPGGRHAFMLWLKEVRARYETGGEDASDASTAGKNGHSSKASKNGTAPASSFSS